MENSTPAVAAAWSLSFDDLLFVRSFPTASRLGSAVQLLHFRLHARFFDDWAEIGSEVLRYVADQTETNARHAAACRLGNRTARRHRTMIVDREGFARLSKQVAAICWPGQCIMNARSLPKSTTSLSPDSTGAAAIACIFPATRRQCASYGPPDRNLLRHCMPGLRMPWHHRP